RADGVELLNHLVRQSGDGRKLQTSGNLEIVIAGSFSSQGILLLDITRVSYVVQGDSNLLAWSETRQFALRILLQLLNIAIRASRQIVESLTLISVRRTFQGKLHNEFVIQIADASIREETLRPLDVAQPV